MTVIVTLDMYSGLPNPSWEIPEADAEKLAELLSRKRARSTVAAPGSTGRLGYRGLLISSPAGGVAPMRLRAFDGIVEAASLDTPNFIDDDSEIESFLLSTAGPALRTDEIDYIQAEIQKNATGGIANSMRSFDLMAVPPYNPAKWNNDPSILQANNCYNYGNDEITNTFAQPGLGSGQAAPYPPSCSGTTSAAVRDGLKQIPSPDVTPADGHIAALVVSTTVGFFDYHWYRLDSNALWSHKPGRTPARNTDNSGRLILDPRTCDRGPYNNFCGFFNSVPSKIMIR